MVCGLQLIRGHISPCFGVKREPQGWTYSTHFPNQQAKGQATSDGGQKWWELEWRGQVPLTHT